MPSLYISNSPISTLFNQPAMASSSSSSSFFCFLTLFFLLLTPFFLTVLSQPPSSSNIGSCQPQLLSLVPCTPFVQGTVQSPAGPCCNNLDRIYRQQPNCICLLLSSSEFNSLPINSSLALQLPQLCHLQGDASVCSVPAPSTVPSERAPTSPASQISLGANNDPSVAASPMVQVAPRPSIIRSGSSQSNGRRLSGEGMSAIAGVVMVALLMACPCV